MMKIKRYVSRNGFVSPGWGFDSWRQSHMFKNGPCRHDGVSRVVFLSRCAMFSTGLPVVEGQDLERGGPASAGEVERAAGNRGAAGLHTAPTRHRYADTLCCSLSFCLSVRPSASERPGVSDAPVTIWFHFCVVTCVCLGVKDSQSRAIYVLDKNTPSPVNMDLTHSFTKNREVVNVNTWHAKTWNNLRLFYGFNSFKSMHQNRIPEINPRLRDIYSLLAANLETSETHSPIKPSNVRYEVNKSKTRSAISD